MPRNRREGTGRSMTSLGGERNRHKDLKPVQGAPKRHVNAEEMLAELKRVLESSTPAPHAPPPRASPAAKPSSQDRESRRSQVERGSDRPAMANAKKSIGPRTDRQNSTKPRSRGWKLIAGGLALAGAATIGVSFALMNKAPDLAEHELSVAAAERMVRSQNEQTVEPASPPGPAAPASTPAPPNQAATLVTSHRIGPDGAPLATAPSAPASPDSTPPLADAPKTPLATTQAIRPNGSPIAMAPSTPLRPSPRRLWLTRQRRGPRRQPRKQSGRTRRQLQQRRLLPLRPLQRRL